MQGFDALLKQVRPRFASEADLLAAMPVVLAPDDLARIPDDRYLSSMCLRIFRAGLRHSMVDARWPAFEDVFHQFRPPVLSRLSDEQLEARMAKEGIIKHWGKVRAIRANAFFVEEIAAEYGSFGRWLADWPLHDLVGLWAALKKRGSQLGGNSGPMLLRMVGKDTFVLSADVVVALQREGVIDRKPGSQKTLAQVQAAFNRWHEESGWHYSHISRVLAFSTGPAAG